MDWDELGETTMSPRDAHAPAGTVEDAAIADEIFSPA